MTGTAKLVWKLSDEGLSFSVAGNNGIAIAPDEWGLYEVVVGHDQRGGVSPLVGLIEDGVVVVGSLNDVMVPHALIAAFDEPQARQLGLPSSAPVRLHVKGQGILTSPSFRFQHQLVMSNGSP